MDPARDDGEESAYQYCAGEPVGSVDPSGRITLVGAAGAVLFVVSAYLTVSTFKKLGYYKSYSGQRMLLVGYRQWLWANNRTRYWSLQSTSKLYFGVHHQNLGSNQKRAAAVYYSGQKPVFDAYVWRVFKWDVITTGIPSSLPTKF